MVFSNVTSTVQAVHNVTAVCGRYDTTWFMAQIQAYYPTAYDYITDLTSECGSIIFKHYCLGGTTADANALCTALMNDATLQSVFANPDGDGDSDSALYSLLVLLLIPIGLAAFAVYHHKKRKVPDAPLYFGPQLAPNPVPALYASPIPLSPVPTPPPPPGYRFAPPPVPLQ